MFIGFKSALEFGYFFRLNTAASDKIYLNSCNYKVFGSIQIKLRNMIEIRLYLLAKELHFKTISHGSHGFSNLL